MKKGKSARISALLVVVSMIVIVLAACGDNKTKNANTPLSSTESAQPPATEITVTRHLWSGELDFKADNALVKAYNAAANVNLKYDVTESSQYATKTNLLMSANRLPDIVYGELPETSKYGSEGAYLNLDKYLDKYPAVRDAISPVAWDEVRNVSVDGNPYLLPLYTGYAPFVIAYREDWLQKLGISEPQTFAEFTEMLIKFRDSDLDGNKVKDTIPLAMSATDVLYQVRDMWPIFGTVHPDGWMVNPDNKDEIIMSAMHPKTKDYLKAMRSLREDGLLDAEFLVGKQSGRDKFISGNVGAVVIHVNEMAMLQEGLPLKDPNAKAKILGALTGPKGDIGGMVLGNVNVGGFAINAKSEAKADKIFEYLQWQATTGREMVEFGVEGKTYSKENGTIKAFSTNDIPEDYRGGVVLKLVWTQEMTDAHPNWRRMFATDQEFDAHMKKINNIIDNGISDVKASYGLNTKESEQHLPNINPKVDEFVTKAIIQQNYDIDKEWETMKASWYKSGGEEVTKSFNKMWNEKRK